MTDSYSTPPQPSPAAPGPFGSGSPAPGSSAPSPFGPGQDLTPPPAPVAPSSAKSRGRSGRVLNAVLAVAVAIAIAGVAFAVGRGTANASTAQNDGQGRFFNGQGFGGNGNGNGGNGNGNGGNGPGGFVGNGNGPGGFFGGGGGITLEGTVSSVSADSITVKTAAGAEITISTNGETTYHQQAAATSSDVKTGSTVKVQVDGFRGRFGGGGPNASPAPSGAPRTTATDITVVP